MSIFKDKITAEEAFRGIIQAPKWPPTREEMAAGLLSRDLDQPGFAASSANDQPGYFENRNRMNVRHAPTVRRGHGY